MISVPKSAKSRIGGTAFCFGGMCTYHYLVRMFLKRSKDWRYPEGDRSVKVPYYKYRIAEKVPGPDGKPRTETVLWLGDLPGFGKSDREALASSLISLIETGQPLLQDDPFIEDTAYEFYGEWLKRTSGGCGGADAVGARALAKASAKSDGETLLRMSSLKVERARKVGPEHICKKVLDRLQFVDYLKGCGWSAEKAELAAVQVIERAVRPYSELKTVSEIRENSAVCELYGIDPASVNKDSLYGSALSLYEERLGLESHLNSRVRSLFGSGDVVYILDTSNTYMEGRMVGSQVFRFGRCKSKRYDCKIVVLALVVDSDGVPVHTMLYEGNRQDVTVLQEVIGAVTAGMGLSPDARPSERPLLVIDAGFNSSENLEWLSGNGWDYITVRRSDGSDYTPAGEPEVVTDSKGQYLIQIQNVRIDGVDDTLLLVDSEGKTAKEASMDSKALQRFEDGLESIRRGIEGRGTKDRDKVNARYGRLKQRCRSVWRCFDVTFEYAADNPDRTVGMRWARNDGEVGKRSGGHGKYIIQSSASFSGPERMWDKYNAVRTVEGVFRICKTDLNIRPVYHKTDKGGMAHIHLAILAYWVAAYVLHELSEHGIHVTWSEVVRIAEAQQRVDVVGETDGGNTVRKRMTTEPEEKLKMILDALGISHTPVCFFTRQVGMSKGSEGGKPPSPHDT